VGWDSRILDLAALINGAAVAGLDDGTAVGADALREALAGGYTSGEYVTGANVNSVIRPDAELVGGVWVRRITTRLTDPPYPWYWEVGWHSSTGRFFRVEKWRPTIERVADAMALAFALGAERYIDERLAA
jgi:hypothetical protein